MKNNTIVLTSTIDSNRCSFVQRTDIEVRKKDHLDTLSKFLTHPEFRFVVIENSNYDLGCYREMFANELHRIELISYDGNNYNRGLGKGYGELDMLLYVIRNSEYLKEDTHFTKISGRYYMTKISEVLKDRNQYDYVYYDAQNPDLRQTRKQRQHTFFYYTPKDIFYNYFYNNNQVNDSGGKNIESIIYHYREKNSFKNLMVTEIGLNAISATVNREHKYEEKDQLSRTT